MRDVAKSKNYYGSGIHITSSIKMHGKENFTKDILEELEVPDKDLLCEREMFWIREKQTKHPNGYNLTDGGDGARGMTEETKDKIRSKNKLKVGPLNSRHGKKNSAQHNQRLRDFNTGKVLSEETKEKLRAANVGKKRSAESIEKTRQANLGRKHGVEWTEKVRLNQPNSIAVMQFSKSGEFIAEYVSASEAMRLTGVFAGSILNCCKGNSKTAGKCVWKYKEAPI